MLLTRLPVTWLLGSRAPATGVWAYPLVGAVIGGGGAIVFWAGHAIGLPPALAAAWTLAASLLLSGGLHEDGLADTADGFGGGDTATRKLAIMRDSRIGSYGALALMLSLGMRGAAIAVLRDPATVAAALVTTGGLARGAMVGIACLLSPARPDGLGAALGRVPPRTGAVALAIAAGCTVTLPGPAAAMAVGAALMAAVVVATVAHRQVGGSTGDILGAGEQVAECAVLSVLAAIIGG